jgi:HTH-type transcriptional regulator/antitoxin HipB
VRYRLTALHQLRAHLLGFRKHAGLSQAALAAQLGISQQSYAKIEANPASTSVERLFTILRLLGAELIFGTDFEPDEQSAPHAAPQHHPDPAPPAVLPPSQRREPW